MKILHFSRYIALSFIITVAAQANSFAAEEEHTPLGDQMEQIGQAWRMVKRGARDAAKNAQTLAQAKKIQAAVKIAMNHKPDMLEDIADAKKRQFIANYIKDMKMFAEKIDKLVELLEGGDNDAASALIKQIDEHREQSHDHYKRPE